MTPRRVRPLALLLSALGFVWSSGPWTTAVAQTVAAPTTPTTVSILGGAAGETRRLPAGQAEFGIRVPLRPNAENVLTITATNDQGQRASAEAKVTQITLGEVVRARVTAQRLTTQEVRALVADGVIDIKDPTNFNVSVFIIALTINGQQTQVQVPVVSKIEEPVGFGEPVSIGCSQTGQIQTTERAIAIPCGGGGGASSSNTPTIQIIPFEIDVPDAQVDARVPGVILIEGRIKTLKEFFKVNLLLMNVSNLFTLRNVSSRLEVPQGALTHVAPASGTVSIPDIAPGGESTGEFIVRGDRIGTHTVTAHFGAELVSQFLPEPVPIAGSASTDLEVKGPPQLAVTVQHPNFVRAGEDYDLVVHIENTDEELDALYTTFELDVGIDARLVDPVTGTLLEGPSVHELGDILRGQRATRRFRVRPSKTGPISSCTAAATQNIQLTVAFTGTGNGPRCAIGTLPTTMVSSDGRPTVVVVPTHNTTGVSIDPAITAIFSAPMIVETITAGFDGASFRVVDPAGNVVPGTLLLGSIFGGTAAAFRVATPLQNDTEYTVVVEPGIFDENGLALASGLVARFRTESAVVAPDTEAPQGTLVIEPPLDPDAVTRGRLVPVIVDSTDNVAVTRVDLLLDGQLVDTTRPQSPVRFLVDTAALAQGSAHTLLARLRDDAGNERTLQAQLRIAGDLTPPSLTVDAPTTVARGRGLPVVVHAADDGRVDRVELALDGATDALTALLVPPFSYVVQTAGLAPGAHVVVATAIDGAGNRASLPHPFEVAADAEAPAVVFLSPTPGFQVRPGTPISVVTTATDNIGVASVEVFLDTELTPRNTGIAGFSLSTVGLATGAHRLRAAVRDLAGNSGSAEVQFLLVEPTADTTPPAAPVAALMTVSLPANRAVLVAGQDGSVENGARVEVQNQTSLATVVVSATATGSFSATVEGDGGDVLSIVAIDAAGNRGASTTMTVPRPATLTTIVVAPAAVVLSRAVTSQLLSVTGTFSDGSSRPLAAGDVQFLSLAPTVADVTAGGVVVPGLNGAGTIRVTSGSAAAVLVPVTVAMPTLSSVAVSPTTVTLHDIGRTAQLTLTATFSDGVQQPYTGGATFATAAAGVASVDSAGLVTAVGVGDTAVSIVPAGFPLLTVPVAVRRVTLDSITVSPSSVVLTGFGQTQSLTVTGHYSDGRIEVLPGGIQFVSQNAGVATVANGVVTSIANGTTAIDVTVAGVAPVSVPVTVRSLVSLRLAPPTFTLIGSGRTQQLVVSSVFSDGSEGAAPSGVAFETADASVATVSGTGLVTSTGLGSAAIRARFGALPVAESTLTVIALVATDVLVTPSSRTLHAAGEQETLSVTVRFNDGTVGPPTVAPSFSTRDAAVATVNAAGVVTAVSNGSTVIDVSADGGQATVSITVDIPVALPPPVIDSLDRPRAAEGDRFAIRGRNFGATPPANVTRIGGVVATVLSARRDELVAEVPVGAASGDVTVTVAGQASNAAALAIYPRVARSTNVTSAVSTTAGPLTFDVPGIVVRAGDRVVLSSAPDTLAPLTFVGSMTARVNGGPSRTLTSGGQAPDVTADFGVGTHALQLRLDGASVSSLPIYLVVGPDATGVIAGTRSVLSVNQSLPTPITFWGLTGLNDLPLADGTVVAVSTLGGCNHRDRAGNCLNSAGGIIANGVPSASLGDARVRNFTVTGGRIDVLYDPVGTELAVSSEAAATLAVLPTTVGGAFVGTTALANVSVRLTSIDTVHAPRSSSGVIADGLDKLVSIDLQDFRDSAGNSVPDVRIAVSTIGSCTHRDRAGNCLNSDGGVIANGDPSPELGDARLRTFGIVGDHALVQYSPGATLIPVGSTGAATVQVLPARPSGVRISNRTFSESPIALSSASATGGVLTVSPGSVLADGGDNRVTITISGLLDSVGNPVPDGTRVAVSTLGSCSHRDSDGNCINSAGGIITNGTASPELGDARLRVLQVQGGQVVAVYSAEGVALETPQSAVARVAFIPATSPNGVRIGNRAFAVADIALNSAASAVTAAVPTSVVADGLSKTVVISVTNIRDTGGNLLPDGAKVAVSTLGSCSHRDQGGSCINSAGGSIVNGQASLELGDSRLRVFTVTGGQIEVHYDPQPLQLAYPSTDVARIQMLPARADSGVRIGNRAFAVVEVALSSATVDPANVSVVPASVYGDSGTRQSIVTVTGITDAQGRPVPDDTRVAVSTLGSCSHRDQAGSCINGVGGTIDSGTPSPELGDNRIRVHTVTNGSVQVVFNSAPLALSAGQSGTAAVQFLPATPNGVRIGNRVFALAIVTVAGAASGQVTGAGTVAPGGQTDYVVSGLRDAAGVPIPNGAKVAVSTLGGCSHRDVAGNCINSAGGNIVGGDASPELGDARIRVFTVQDGGFAFSFQGPASGTTVLQLLPARPDGIRIGNVAFALKSVVVQ